MGYDAMANNASVPAMSRDFGKKKKANRSAKLKQCKLDARREQWLSQVKNKSCLDGSTEASPTATISQPRMSLPRPDQGVLGIRPRNMNPQLEMEHDGLGLRDSGLDSPVQSPTPGRGEGDDKGGPDDWEAIADALSAAGNHTRITPDAEKITEDSMMNGVEDTRLVAGATKPDANQVTRRAWRPDDAARPHCLPNLSKQRSFPVNIERRFAASGWDPRTIISAPSSCPICVEDFDLTDSSFLPCYCGFRICLFCHKKISEEGDGRCPGCRKKYDRVACTEKIVIAAGLPLPFRFSRSCSMNART
ncbi:hypothetical protein KSP39_PZI024007 [Platanthera zijinensis]|uniref:RING-type domain-containing protein n=1 Tax=Platanthera zijinensis TaxID=2320716 RepID=A0AAP0FT19_9ASPA